MELTPWFVGRIAELDRLRVELGAKKAAGCVLLIGPRRAGKTSLAHAFAETYELLFPGGFHYIDFWNNPEWLHEPSSIADLKLRITRGRRSLVVLDEFPENSGTSLQGILRKVSRYAQASTLVITEGHVPPGLPAGAVRIDLGGLDRQHWTRELARYSPESSALAKSFDFFAGHPSGLVYLRDRLMKGGGDIEALLRPLAPFEELGILGPDGLPLSGRDDEIPESVVKICSHVEERLLTAIQADPDLMYRISPRDFELMVAELLHQEGYEVEVTPASKDGGVDIYAARSESLGRLLFLVECKRYAKSNPVQVDVVRSLYGNVAAKRASAGVLVTSSSFTRGARRFQEGVPHQLSLRGYSDIREWLERTRPK